MMTIKSNGGIFGRNPTFNIVTAEQFVGPISGLAASAAALKSSTTTGLMQITGPIAGQTRTMTIPDADFTAARTDAAQSFTGNQTLTDGNLIVASGKGIDFSATAGTGTSELFNDYEEGTWTPVIAGTGPAGTYELASILGTYTKVGRQVTVHCNLTTGAAVTGGGAGSLIVTGLPFTKAADERAFGPTVTGGLAYAAGGVVTAGFGTSAASASVFFYLSVSNAGLTVLPITLVGVSKALGFSMTYHT
jgi:hypothetical protein